MNYQQDGEDTYQAHHNLSYGPCPKCGDLRAWQPVGADHYPQSGSVFIYLECKICGAIGTVTIGKIEAG